MRSVTLVMLSVALFASLLVAIWEVMPGHGEAAPAVKGIVQRVVTTSALDLPSGHIHQVDATCAEDETLTGGGYQVGSIGPSDKVFVNAPTDVRTWTVELFNNSGFSLDVWAFAVCVKASSKP